MQRALESERCVEMNSIMVLSAAAGAGHVRAAEALVNAFKTKGIEARHIEVLKYTNPVFRRAYSDLYKELCNKNPDILGWIYKAFDRPWKYQKRRLVMDLINTTPFVKLLIKEKPEVALCTHFLPAEILVYLRKKNILNIPIGVVVTDYDAHAMWLYRNVDWYFVACEETKVYLTAMGIPPETIHITGIPVDPIFGVQKAKKDIRLHLGLDTDMTTILVSAGGFGVGPVELMVRTLQNIEHSVQVVIICGKNPQLEQKLKEIKNNRHPVKIIGFTTEMDKWMAASDILVGKAGGLTSSEALASGLVLVIVNPVPGQEERNSDHFLENGVAIRCNNLPTLSHKIDTLLTDKKRFTRMQQNVKSFAKPYAAGKVVSIVLRSIS
jgi:processive 1,2-diacylglycerol beta-glucosyltransferase